MAYPGQPDIPGECNAESVRMFADLVAWCGSMFSHRWLTDKPLDLFGYLQEDVGRFLITIRSISIDQRFSRLDLNVRALSAAVEKTYNFVAACLFPYSSIRQDTRDFQVEFENT